MSATLTRGPPKSAWAPVKYSSTPLGGGTTAQGVAYPGGLDLTTPSLRLQPGALRDCLNFEVAPFGGYRRTDGYERFDGQPSPSSATYTIVQLVGNVANPFTFDQSLFDGPDLLDGGLSPPGHAFVVDTSVLDGPDPLDVGGGGGAVIGLFVTQSVSGATGTIIAIGTIIVDQGSDFTPGDFSGADFDTSPHPEVSVPYVVLGGVTGIFDSSHDLIGTGGVGVGTATPLTIGIDAKSHAIYTALAAEPYRALIQKVPGEGPVLGVVAMAFRGADNVYAFRANVGRTAALLYRASSAGWVLVPYLSRVSFTAGGTAVPMDGDTLTQGGVTATIKRVVWQSGSWAGSAAGQFVIAAPTGGNFAAGAATTTSGATVMLSGALSPITMAARGRFEFVKCNFSGQLITRRIYGCDGVNPPFEFDGETLVPIDTGLSPNAPSHIWFHKNFLFITQDASLIYCAAGNPFKWSSVDGAGEIATGDTVTGLITLPGSQTTATLGVYLRSNTAFLYGTDPTTFNFVTFNNGIGAAPYSVQNLFDTFFLDDLGVVTLKTTLNWGNFLPSTLTKNILPFIQRERGNLVASAVNREKSQYRLFFRDGYALYCTILNQQYLGATPMLFPDAFTSIDTTNLITDTEATYAGGANGYVYRLDVGTSFDGAPIPAYIVTAWDALKSPRILKRYRAASIEVQGGSYAEINYGYQIGYNSDQLAQLPGVALPLNLGAVPQWDAFVWDAFTWDGSGLSPTDIDETGTAENIRVTISSETNYIESYTVDSVVHHYSMRRGMRV